jgi:ATP-dependent DNA ligase
MKSNTMASVSWCGGKARACSVSPRGGHGGRSLSAIVEAAKGLRARSFLIDGEAVVCRPDGLSDFEDLRSRRRGREATLVAFDLIELEATICGT